MAGFFLKPGSPRGHSRSISLPVRSHPTTIKIEQELNNLILNLQISSSSPSPLNAEKLCMAVSGLSELHKSVGDVLKLPQTQQTLVFTKHDRTGSWVDELLEEPLSLLDVCGNTRENVSLLRETLGNLQSALRRSTTSNYIIDNVTDHVSSLKTFKREMGKSLSSLKQIDTKLAVSPMLNNHDHHLVAVVRVLRETSLVSSLIFRAILGYFSASANLQPKASKWSLVLKMVKSKGREDDNPYLNELEDVEVALNSLVVHKERTEMVQSTCKKLQALEKIMERVETELECSFRQLIQTRVSLLNILSDH